MAEGFYNSPYCLKELKIEVTQACPLNCIHCSSNANPGKTTQLSFDLVRQVVTDAAALGVSDVVFSGGEPLVWPHILEAISHASSSGMDICAYTTGRNSLNGRNDPSLPKQLREAGLKRAVFSIYGRRNSYERITRVNGSHEQTVLRIQEFQSNGIETQIHFVPMHQNFRELQYVVDLAIELAIKKISILRFVPHGRGAFLRKTMILANSENLELRRAIKRLRRQNPSLEIRLGSPYNFLLVEKEVFCMAGIDRLIIGPDGSAYPCDAFKNYEVDGNEDSLYQKSLHEIWESSNLCQRTREYLASEPYDECARCMNFPLCKSGCLAQKAMANGDFRMDKDPDCLAEVVK